MMRRGGDDGLEERRDDAPSPSRELAAKQQLLHVERALASDPEALTVHRLVCEGFTTPAELAEALGWPVARVKAVRLRTSRRLKSMRVTLEGDGEQPASEDLR